jgi:hypothetical protein
VLIQCGPAAAERWVIVHAPDAELEGRLAADIGLDSLPTLPEAAVTDQECDAVLGKAHGLGLAAAPLLDGEAVLFDESLNDRGLFELVDRDGVGSRPHPRLFAVLADGQPIGVPLRPPPRLGQHNEEILGGLLGLDNTQLATLAAERIIGTRPKGGLPRPFSTPLDLAELERRHRARRVPEARSRWERHFGDRSHAARQAPPQQSLPGPAQEVPDQRRAPGWTDRAECDRGDAARMQAGQPHAVAASPAEPGEVLSPDGP